MSFFTENERTALFNRILNLGQSDKRVSGGALVGSFSTNKQDRWSDIDISFGIKSEIDPLLVLNEWTEILNEEYNIVHHFDVKSSLAIYRVLLFPNGLEVDLSVVPEIEFGPRAPSFKLLFGKANEIIKMPSPSLDLMHSWGWHHVLHANSAINRKKLWQAEFWVTSIRNYIISMKCIRLGLPASYSRGADQLPENELKVLEQTFIKKLSQEELKRVLNIISKILIAEIKFTNAGLANKLVDVFQKALDREFSFNTMLENN